MRENWQIAEAGYSTGKARAEHDLTISPMFAIAAKARQEGPYGAVTEGPFDRGYVRGYSDAVARWLR